MMNDLLKALKAGICVVIYEKLDSGEIREMECTLNPALIPANYEVEQKPGNSDIVVWCTDRDAWRSFRANTMQDWRIK